MPFYDFSIKRFYKIFLLIIFLFMNTNVVLAAELPVPQVVSFSPIELFQQADIIVKIVMIILVLFSILSWVIWLAKTYELRIHKKKLINSIRYIHNKKTIDEHFDIEDPAAQIIQEVAYNEFQTVKSKTFILENGVKDRVGFQIERIIENEKSRLNRGTNFLATTGAITPFIGLLGTVWGIIHSFVSIAQTNVTNLSVVAPGIAEALFATALGLVAAIPAVILYNNIVRQISYYGLLLEDVSVLIHCLFGRDVDSLQEQNILFHELTKGK
ncbi:tonB-system energizer ExbB [Acinetobacter lactucae]|uniref:tonB-system energizer ExbB n=1 Tax=Acinetobacter lactucae TaxID=1785128 RepID=UPI00077E30EA|nr:tonB-system energizer ExbB [Acinetobacter lactucae]